MRLFVAIEIPEEIRKNLAALLQDLRAVSPQTKWVRPGNMHLTLKFLGETDPVKLVDLRTALASIRSPQPVALRFHGLGFFPDNKRPRVFWAGIESSSNLSSIATEIDQTLHKLGFPREDRPFTPHLTLARFTRPSIPAGLQAAATANASRSFGSFSASQFYLIESKLKSTGAEYTTLQSYPFVSEA